MNNKKEGKTDSLIIKREMERMRLKLRKAVSVGLLAAVLSGMLFGCGAAEEKIPDEGENLPALKIGVDLLKPFFYMDESGDYAGFDAEISAEACRRAGYSPEYIEVSWSERDRYLESGSVDCIWTAFIKDGREDGYLWTEDYLESALAVMVDERSPDESISDLKNPGGVAVRAGSKAEELLLKEGMSVYCCGSFQMAETAFIKGYAGALAGHREVLRRIMEDYPGSYRILDGTLMTVHLGVAFEKGNDALMEEINSVIREMKEDGTISAIEKQYESDLSDGKGVNVSGEN